MTCLRDYPNGTRVSIGTRTFEKVRPTSFWREKSDVPGNRVTRPAVSLEGIEDLVGERHVVLGPVDGTCEAGASQQSQRERAGS